ncbi:MAG: cytochrome c, partial [Candidatus Acidiferrum sp.]
TQNISRMLAFKLNGKASLPPLPEFTQPVLNPPHPTASAAIAQKGEGLFQNYCSTCHGDVAVSGGVLPDLRYSGTLGNSAWTEVVLGGTLQPYGMVSFSKELSKQDVEAIRAYVILRANQSLANSNAAAKP